MPTHAPAGTRPARLTIRIAADLREALRARAYAERCTETDVIERALGHFLAKEPQAESKPEPET